MLVFGHIHSPQATDTPLMPQTSIFKCQMHTSLPVVRFFSQTKTMALGDPCFTSSCFPSMLTCSCYCGVVQTVFVCVVKLMSHDI